jgi:hypothetical protein
MSVEWDANKGSRSTTSEWEWKKIRRRPKGPSSASTKSASSSVALSAWPRREPLTVTVVYRGGPEAWVELRARGEVIRVPGSLALFDALERLWR